MKDTNKLTVYESNFFGKIKNFFKKIFNKNANNINTANNITEEKSQTINNSIDSKKRFNEYISFKENKEELDIINSIRKNPEQLRNMNDLELDKIENAIRNRQNYVNKKIEKLKTDLMRKNSANAEN